jgi:phosphatidylglycerol lysyltransferase
MGASPLRVRDLVLELGTDAMSFLAVESGMKHWLVDDGGTVACVAYVDTRTAWVAACGPLARATDRARVALQFVEAARAHGRRACFFATGALASERLSHLLIGEQPVFRPADWLRELPRHRRLREQLRRARAKGVRVRRLDDTELGEASPVRRELDRLATEWLSGRHLEPMGFLVAVEPFHHPEEHRYFIAEHRGRIAGFLSAVPIGPRRAWLIEDVFRSRDAPNGTTETLIHALMRHVADAEYVTAGLVPLGGPVVVATLLASVDAALSLGHLAWIGTGTTLLQMSLRGAATVAPVVGALLLTWATTRTSP